MEELEWQDADHKQAVVLKEIREILSWSSYYNHEFGYCEVLTSQADWEHAKTEKFINLLQQC